MKPTYSDAGKLAWYPDIACPVCGGDVNSWDKRCSRALGYRQIVCEGCISEEYQVTVENLRYVMETTLDWFRVRGYEHGTESTDPGSLCRRLHAGGSPLLRVLE